MAYFSNFIWLIANEIPEAAVQLNARLKEERKIKLKETTIDAIAGGSTANVLYLLAQEQQRAELFDEMISKANQEIEIRRKLEAFEAGRRQKENMNYPSKVKKEVDNNKDDNNGNNNNDNDNGQ